MKSIDSQRNAVCAVSVVLALTLNVLAVSPCSAVTQQRSGGPPNVVKGPADGTLLLSSGKNNFVRSTDKLVYLKGGSLLVMLKAPATELTVATRAGIVRIERDGSALISYQDGKLVIDNVDDNKQIKIALSEKAFPDAKDRVVELGPKQQFSAAAVLPAASAQAAGAAPEATPPSPAGSSSKKTRPEPVLMKTAQKQSPGTYSIANMTAAALNTAAGVLNVIAASKSLLPWQYVYLRGFTTVGWLSPYLTVGSWYTPAGWDWSATSLETTETTETTETMTTESETSEQADLEDMHDANDLSDDHQLNDADTDNDGVSDAHDDDGTFDDDGGGDDGGDSGDDGADMGGDDGGGDDGGGGGDE